MCKEQRIELGLPTENYEQKTSRLKENADKRYLQLSTHLNVILQLPKASLLDKRWLVGSPAAADLQFWNPCSHLSSRVQHHGCSIKEAGIP